jgi:protein ImuA
MNEILSEVIRRQDTWLGREGRVGCMPAPANSDSHQHGQRLATGYSTLDAALHQRGWPLGGGIEVLSDSCGMGSMGLFLPVMEALSTQKRWQAFIAPPYIPYAPLLAARGVDVGQVLLVHPRSREDLLWSTEQALRSTTCSAVFSWLGAGPYRYAELRKLQLAAASGNTLSVLFRANSAAHEHSPASLRLQMQAYRQVHILKQRGGQQGVDVFLPPSEDVPDQPQLWELPAVAGELAVSASSTA